MHVLIAPDSFTGTLTAREAAAAIARGWRVQAPGDRLELVPVSDGGPGFLAVLHESLGGRLIWVPSVDPAGDRISAQVLVVPDPDGGVGYVESARFVGLELVAGQRRDVMTASSVGLADGLRAVASAGVERVVIGLGGSGISDGGAGLLAGLGARATGRDGRDVTDALVAGVSRLTEIADVDLDPARSALGSIRDIVIASDVAGPLLGSRGAARGYAPQKGANPEQVEVIEGALSHLATCIGRGPDGKDPAVALGAGAAGGLGYALMVLGGHRVSGVDLVLAALGFDDRVDRADLVITGEGRLDWQSTQGKVIQGVCRAALDRGKPVVAMAGQVDLSRRELMGSGIVDAWALYDPWDDRAMTAERDVALASPADLLAALSRRVARTWSRPL